MALLSSKRTLIIVGVLVAVVVLYVLGSAKRRDNAQPAADSGQCRVTVTADPPRVTVFDNGVGIASELRERIFERFFRITEGDLDPRPGTGLGLYISRSLAERQGANLRLEWSRPGRGSAFVLAFPQASLRSEESDGAAPSPLRAATPDSDATEAARTA